MKIFFLAVVTYCTLTASTAFITPNELKHTLANENLIIMDVASRSTYKKAHIKGAISVEVAKLKDPTIIQDNLRELGLKQDSKVIIYSHNTDKGILDSSFLAFLLIYNGFENVMILDGGYMAWVFEYELLTSSEVTDSLDDGDFIQKINFNIISSKSDILKHSSFAKLIDARSPQLYYGTERSKGIERVGHIPSAKSSYYKDKFLTDSTLRGQDELDEIYIDGLKFQDFDEIIVYSRDLYDATMEWYIIYKQMGFKDAKIYKDGLLEWGNDKESKLNRYRWE